MSRTVPGASSPSAPELSTPPPGVFREVDPQRVYHVLFSGPIPPVLAARFRGAWRLLEGDYTPHEQDELEEALAAECDLEALEFAARLRRRLPALRAQVRLMAFLAETLPERLESYVNTDDRCLAGWGALVWAGLRSAWKLGKGLYLLRRLDAR